MRKHSSIMWLMLVAVLFVASCGGRGGSVSLTDSRDSLSYVVGMNIAYNIMQMDSTLRPEMVMAGVEDAMLGQEQISLEDGKFYLLSYMNYDVYERTKRFESQFLEDLRKADRKFVATHSGLTYKIDELGNLKKSARNSRDTMDICYRILNVAGEVVDTTFYKRDTLRLGLGQMVRGLQEATRLIGEGGHIEAWIPSSLAFGSEGCDSLNIKPNTMLYYEMWLVDVEER